MRWILGCGLALFGGCSDAPPSVSTANQDAGRLGITEILAGEQPAGFERAVRPRAFGFPADHGAHPDFRSEWWYFTGNLRSKAGAVNAGRRFGFHLTFFRNALRPKPEVEPADRPSGFRTRQLWMAHFAVVDIATGKVAAAERFARGIPGIASASTQPFAVEVDGWRMASVGADFSPLRLQGDNKTAEGGGAAIALELTARKPIVLHGDAGLSQKSAASGNASHYYTITRWAASGSVTVGGVEHDVVGTAWFDREWSTSALARDQAGWDWFALHLDDDRELVWYRMRRKDGSTDPFSKGLLVHADGTTTALGVEDVTMKSLRTWRSPRSQAVYPVGWRLTIPRIDLDLEVQAAVDDQELDLTFRYFEGAVVVKDRRAGNAPIGRGYLEMTGYAPD